MPSPVQGLPKRRSAWVRFSTAACFHARPRGAHSSPGLFVAPSRPFRKETESVAEEYAIIPGLRAAHPLTHVVLTHPTIEEGIDVLLSALK